MIRLHCPAQNYDWGKPGQESEVAALWTLNSGQPVEARPYAELWMGTHPSAPSKLAGGDGTALKAWIEANPTALGSVVHDRWGAELPYLFKILSVATALSIQAHPDKALAEKLHGERPGVYKDANHKPEMAVAISVFEALSGFVTPEELAKELEAVPELKAAVGAETADAFVGAQKAGADTKAPFKAAFTKLMTCEAPLVAECVETLVKRLRAEQATRELTPKELLVLRLMDQYPKDIGILSAYFLNHIVLQPGQAIYMAANEPHAYLAGECAEVMATSDNVVRAGLTPKLRDTDILCEMLTYNTGAPELLCGDPVDSCTKAYRPPFDEFAMDIVTVPSATTHTMPAAPGPLLVLVHQGSGTAEPSVASEDPSAHSGKVARGDVYFVPAGCAIKLEGGAGEDLKLIACGCNPRIF